MSKNVTNLADHINPIRLTDTETGAVYELDFSRESVQFAERNKFRLDEAMEFPVTGMRDLFYYSFRKNHRNVARDRADKLFDRWGGGIPEKLAKRLVELYAQAQASNTIVADSEEAEKNSGLTLEID